MSLEYIVSYMIFHLRGVTIHQKDIHSQVGFHSGAHLNMLKVIPDWYCTCSVAY